MNTANVDLIEPAISGTQVNLKLLIEEYSTKSIQYYNSKFQRSEDIEYYSISSRTYSPASYQLRYTNSFIFGLDKLKEHQNDGIICQEESIEGITIADLLSDHYELLGLNGEINSKVFDIYANHFKSLDNGIQLNLKV
jgi:hypothetical protein